MRNDDVKFDETYPHIADWIKNRNSISMQEIHVGLYAVSASEESIVAVLLSFTDVESVHGLFERLEKGLAQYIATEEVTDEEIHSLGLRPDDSAPYAGPGSLPSNQVWESLKTASHFKSWYFVLS